MAPPAPGPYRGNITERWAATPGILLRDWGDEWVAYIQATGSTHLLSASAGELLSLLCGLRSPSNIEELLSLFNGLSAELPAAPKTGSQPTADESTLRVILDEFTRIGLTTMHSW